MKGCVLFKRALFAALPANICAKYIDIIRKKSGKLFYKGFCECAQIRPFQLRRLWSLSSAAAGRDPRRAAAAYRENDSG